MDKIYTALPKSYKNAYPFKVAAPSYIYPDHIIANVKMLANYVDEIEIILFESRSKDSLPSNDVIHTLSRISRDFNLTYNIHLPIDICLGHHDSTQRRYAVDIIKQIADLTAPLSPSSFTLHLEYNQKYSKNDLFAKWQEQTGKSIQELLDSGIRSRSLSIETLTYPFEWVADMIVEFDLSVCLDIGHLILENVDPETIFNQYSEKIAIIHLHGVENRRDHLSLVKLSKTQIASVLHILKRFNEVLSLEVFSYSKLKDSLKFLEKCWLRS
ncbi:MAG: sugar phosphate isomerase/epimerase [Desulfobacterales bacterium]|nr:sugar phosphate isomerase/epimerase [Desulfobacterales bacterium]